MKTGIQLITEERQEQIEKHGWTSKHDDQHKASELISASLFVITLQDQFKQYGFEEFERRMWDKTQTERYTVAGALIAAEIDRLQRT